MAMAFERLDQLRAGRWYGGKAGHRTRGGVVAG